MKGLDAARTAQLKIEDFEDKSLLIVDDDDPLRNRLSRAMEKKGFKVNEAKSVKEGLNIAKTNTFDSLFSCCITDDLYLWDNKSGELNSINYNYKKRQRRQDNLKQYIENGSFYLFTPDALRKHNNRFGSKIGVVEMEFWKMFEIDTLEDFRICELFMKEFLS